MFTAKLMIIVVVYFIRGQASIVIVSLLYYYCILLCSFERFVIEMYIKKIPPIDFLRHSECVDTDFARIK